MKSISVSIISSCVLDKCPQLGAARRYAKLGYLPFTANKPASYGEQKTRAESVKNLRCLSEASCVDFSFQIPVFRAKRTQP